MWNTGVYLLAHLNYNLKSHCFHSQMRGNKIPMTSMKPKGWAQHLEAYIYFIEAFPSSSFSISLSLKWPQEHQTTGSWNLDPCRCLRSLWPPGGIRWFSVKSWQFRIGQANIQPSQQRFSPRGEVQLPNQNFSLTSCFIPSWTQIISQELNSVRMHACDAVLSIKNEISMSGYLGTNWDRDVNNLITMIPLNVQGLLI